MNLNNSHNAARPIRQAFVHWLQGAPGAVVTTFDVSPVTSSGTLLFGTNCTTEASLYAEFKCVGIEVTAFPSSHTNTGVTTDATAFAIGYSPTAAASAPSSFLNILALSDSAVQTIGCTVPVKFRLTRKMLSRGQQVKWYHQDVTPDVDTCIQGRLYYVCAGTHAADWVCMFLIRSTWEFRGPVSSGQFLERLRVQNIGQDGSDSGDCDSDDSKESPVILQSKRRRVAKKVSAP